MKREIITITDEGAVVVPTQPNRVRMTIGEIAALLGIFHPTAKRHVRAIEKSGIAGGDYSMTCVMEGTSACPLYYGLEMVAAVSFRVRSWQADAFRRWLVERAANPAPKFQPPVTLILPVRGGRLPS